MCRELKERSEILIAELRALSASSGASAEHLDREHDWDIFGFLEDGARCSRAHI